MRLRITLVSLLACCAAFASNVSLTVSTNGALVAPTNFWTANSNSVRGIVNQALASKQDTNNAGAITNTFPVPTRLVFAGDSLTSGYSTEIPGWPTWLTNYLRSPNALFFTNAAFPGRRVESIATNYAAELSPFKPASGTNAILFVFAGQNNIGSESTDTLYGSLSNIWRLAKADGYLLAVFTLPPINDLASWQTARSALNTRIRQSDTWDYLVDTERLLSSWRSDRMVDGIHYTTNANRLIAREVARILSTCVPRLGDGQGLHDAGNFTWLTTSNLVAQGAVTVLGSVNIGIGGTLVTTNAIHASAGNGLFLAGRDGDFAYQISASDEANKYDSWASHLFRYGFNGSEVIGMNLFQGNLGIADSLTVSNYSGTSGHVIVTGGTTGKRLVETNALPASMVSGAGDMIYSNASTARVMVATNDSAGNDIAESLADLAQQIATLALTNSSTNLDLVIITNVAKGEALKATNSLNTALSAQIAAKASTNSPTIQTPTFSGNVTGTTWSINDTTGTFTGTYFAGFGLLDLTSSFNLPMGGVTGLAAALAAKASTNYVNSATNGLARTNWVQDYVTDITGDMVIATQLSSATNGLPRGVTASGTSTASTNASGVVNIHTIGGGDVYQAQLTSSTNLLRQHVAATYASNNFNGILNALGFTPATNDDYLTSVTLSDIEPAGELGDFIKRVGDGWSPASLTLADIGQTGAELNQVPHWTTGGWVPVTLADNDTLGLLGQEGWAGAIPVWTAGGWVLQGGTPQTGYFLQYSEATGWGAVQYVPINRIEPSNANQGQIISYDADEGEWTYTDPPVVVAGPGVSVTTNANAYTVSSTVGAGTLISDTAQTISDGTDDIIVATGITANSVFVGSFAIAGAGNGEYLRGNYSVHCTGTSAGVSLFGGGDTSAGGPSVTAVAESGNLIIRVTGVSGKNMNWSITGYGTQQ